MSKKNENQEGFDFLKSILSTIILVVIIFYVGHRVSTLREEFGVKNKKVLPTGKEEFDVNIKNTSLYPGNYK